MSTPTVTVAIANYNGARFLGATISSVLAQTLEEFELIVVDNRSTDDSRDVVASFDDPRISLRAYEDHVGVVENWARSVADAKGEFAALLHSDDLWRPEFLEQMVEALREHELADAAVCNVGIIDADGGALSRPGFATKMRTKSGLWNAADYERLLLNMNIYPCAWLARSRLFAEMAFDPTFQQAPDWEFWLRVASTPNRIVNVPAVLSDYRFHAASGTFDERTLREMIADETAIVDSAIDRRPVGVGAARQAKRNIDVRCLIRVVQVATLRRYRLALSLVGSLLRRRGLLRVLRACVAVVALDETKATLRGAVTKRKS